MNLNPWPQRKRGRRPSSTPSGLILTESQHERFGTLKQCRKCSEECKQYQAIGLIRVVCKMSKDYQEMAEIFDC